MNKGKQKAATKKQRHLQMTLYLSNYLLLKVEQEAKRLDVSTRDYLIILLDRSCGYLGIP